MLGLCKEGKTEDGKNSDSFRLSPCSLAALQCCLPGELPPPRSHHPAHLLQAPPSCHPLPLPCLSFAPQTVECWPLWDTSAQLEHYLQYIAAFLQPSSSKLHPSCLHRTRDSGLCCNPRHFVGQANTRGAVQRKPIHAFNGFLRR